MYNDDAPSGLEMELEVGGNMGNGNVNFEVEIQVAERGEGLYAATIMPFHVTGYSDTFDGAIDRAKEGLDHLLEAYEADGNLMGFLDESGVEYTLTAETATVDSAVRRVGANGLGVVGTTSIVAV